MVLSPPHPANDLDTLIPRPYEYIFSVEVKFIEHKINPLTAHRSVALSAFVVLCARHLYLAPKPLCHPNTKPMPLKALLTPHSPRPHTTTDLLSVSMDLPFS